MNQILVTDRLYVTNKLKKKKKMYKTQFVLSILFVFIFSGWYIYSEVQKNIVASKAILDIQVSKTAGPSLRALEAVFYNKKLLTDDKNVKTFKFYNKQNIFIIDEDDWDNLNEFLDSPVLPVKEEDIEYYNVKNWLSRFGSIGEKRNAQGNANSAGFLSGSVR